MEGPAVLGHMGGFVEKAGLESGLRMRRICASSKTTTEKETKGRTV